MKDEKINAKKKNEVKNAERIQNRPARLRGKVICLSVA